MRVVVAVGEQLGSEGFVIRFAPRPCNSRTVGDSDAASCPNLSERAGREGTAYLAGGGPGCRRPWAEPGGALGQIAAEAGKQLQGLLVLNALGNTLKAEVVGQFDGGTDDRDVVRVTGHVEHE